MKTDVREYSLIDIPAMVKGAGEHIVELPNYSRMTFSPERLTYLLTNNLKGSQFQAWVVEAEEGIVGGGAAYCVPGMITWDMIASDVFLYVRKEYRSLKVFSQLINSYKEWALARKAKVIVASQTGGFFPEGSKELELYNAMLMRAGFKCVGTVYHLNMY